MVAKKKSSTRKKQTKRKEIYCGNNAKHPDLRNGTKILGNRYLCLKRGIGIGLNLPLDPSANGPYSPIDKTKYYCGKTTKLPPGYDRFGSLPKCLSVGVGVGKRKKAQEQSDTQTSPGSRFMGYNNLEDKKSSFSFKNRMIYFYIAGVVYMAIAIFLILYFAKPRFVTKKVDNKYKIDWRKFILYYCLFLFFELVILCLLFKMSTKSKR